MQLGTSVAVPDRGDPVARTGELEASARDLGEMQALRRAGEAALLLQSEEVAQPAQGPAPSTAS
jgi:hypothetical protein